MQKDEQFEPIELTETNVISKKGYYDCEVVDFSYRKHNGKPLLVLYFKVFKGKYRGFRLSSGFYYKDLKGRVRLTYMCDAVGISGQLISPKQLLGKRLRLRVVPRYDEYQGRTYRNYRITRFHPVTKMA